MSIHLGWPWHQPCEATLGAARGQGRKGAGSWILERFYTEQIAWQMMHKTQWSMPEQMCTAVKTHSKQERQGEKQVPQPQRWNLLLEYQFSKFSWRVSWSLLMTGLGRMASNPPWQLCERWDTSPGLWGPSLSLKLPSNKHSADLKGFGGHWDKYGAIHSCKAHAIMSCHQMRSTEAPAVNTDVGEWFQPRPSRCSSFHRHLALLCFVWLPFIDIVFLYKLKVYRQQSCIEQVYWSPFAESLYHTLWNSCSIQTFSFLLCLL